jgi:hypothetical protein
MKKTILVLAAIMSFVVMFTACKETKKEEVKLENHEDHDHDKDDMSSNDVYQCPMDCEEGKTYDGEGSCPVCKMDLKVKSSDGEELEKASTCKCKEGGACKCEKGKCNCKLEVASKKMDCTSCESGECKCKA